MALRLGVNSYCTIEQIQTTIGEPSPFDERTEPNLTDVERIAQEGFDRINGELSTEGFSTPFTRIQALNILGPLNADYAAAQIHEGREDLVRSRNSNEQFLRVLERIRDGDIALQDEDDRPSQSDDGFYSSFSDGDVDQDQLDDLRDEIGTLKERIAELEECPPTPAPDPDPDPEPEPDPVEETRYFGWSDYQAITTADLATAANAEADSADLPQRATNGYVWFAVPEANGYPDHIYIEGNDDDQDYFFERQVGTIDDAAGESYIVGRSIRQQTSQLSQHSLTLEYGEAPPQVDTSRYFGWSDDQDIETADLAAVAAVQANVGRLPQRATSGYIWFAIPEAEGYPDELYIEGNPDDQSYFFERQAGTVDDAEGNPHIVGRSLRQQTAQVSNHTITLNYT